MEALKKYHLLVVSILVALVVVPAGAAKLAGVPQLHEAFSALGLPPWFGYFIGACEVAGGIGLFIRRLRAWAAAGLSIIMLGAAYFHLTHMPAARGIPAMLVFLLCAYLVARREAPASSAA